MAPMVMRCPCILRPVVVWVGSGGRSGLRWRVIVMLGLVGMRAVLLWGIRRLMELVLTLGVVG